MKLKPAIELIFVLLCITVLAMVNAKIKQASLDVLEVNNNVLSESSYSQIMEKSQDNVNNSVDNVNNSVTTPELKEHKVIEETNFTGEQLEILAIIIYQEAGGDKCSDDTRRKVGSVFLNRVNSPLFPDTFKEVATAKNQYGRLSKTGIKWPDRASNELEKHAVDRAYSIAEELLIGGSILPENVIWQSEFPQGDGTHCYQDGFYFCYSEVIK